MKTLRKPVLGTILAASALVLMGAGSQSADGPQYSDEGRLRFPHNYREWVFLSSGLGMTYGPLASSADPRFDNVFVSPSAYRAFLDTGRWPDGTVMVLEVRAAQSKGSINRAGHFQGDVVGVETHVKDSRRFPRQWAFFRFMGQSEISESAEAENSTCYRCHEPNGAVDTTFVQFYPTLIPAARAKGTFKAVP